MTSKSKNKSINAFLKRASTEKTNSLSKLEQTKSVQTISEEETEGEGDEELDDFNLKRSSKKNDKEEKEEEEEDKDKDEEEEEEEDEEDTKRDYEKDDKYDDEECMYEHYKNEDLSDNEDDDIGLTEEEEQPKTEYIRITKPTLTKFERVRALGCRAKQLSMGAKPMLKNVAGFSAKEIAKLELENKVMPFIIERQLPNGRIEKWDINELKILN